MRTSRGFGSVRNIHNSSISPRSSFGSANNCNASSAIASNDALLTVFQADPLVYAGEAGMGFHPVPVLDFESERQLLMESLSDVHLKIDVLFDIATTERLGSFLAKGQGRVLHFSCHGHPEYLAIENGWGAMHKLPVEDLRDWIQAGGDNLLFVFVSACHSRAAGDAFVAAGVKHVVCCQRDDQRILNVSSVLFARAFYQALANGRVLSDAFELARLQVRCCPHLDRNERRTEMEKFALLPEDGDHNVKIFEPSTSHRSVHELPSTSMPSSPRKRILPIPPHIFEGRQEEIFRVLDALKSARLVRVTGPVGIGKGSVVKRVCRYIQERQHIFLREISEVLWLPSSGSEDDFLSVFCSIFASNSATTEEAYNRCQQQLMDYLYGNKVLLVIDARKAQSVQSSKKIADFLDQVLHHTTHTRVIVIHHIGDNASIIQKLPCKECDIYLPPLDFQSTVQLFGKLCQHVANRHYVGVSTCVELCTLLIPQGSATDTSRTRRRRNIFQMIGEGIPANIHHAAKTMMGEEYDRMISLALRKEPVLDYQSRTALDKEFSELGVTIQKAVEEKKWLDAKECQERLDEMEILRERLHDLPTLTSLVESVKSDQKLAIQKKDFEAASRLQEELDALEEKIKIERTAMEELGIAEEDCKPAAEDDGKKRETRVELEVQIRALEVDLEKSCDANDFGQARKLDKEIETLKERRSILPTRDQLAAELHDVQNSLKQAKDARDWDLAEDLFSKMQEMQKSMDAEIQAQSLLAPVDLDKDESNLNIDKPGAVAVAGLITESTSAAFDYVMSEESETEEEGEVAELPVARPVASFKVASSGLRPRILVPARPRFLVPAISNSEVGSTREQNQGANESLTRRASAMTTSDGAVSVHDVQVPPPSGSSFCSGFTSPSFFSPEPTSTNEVLTVFQSAPLVEDAVDDADNEPFNGRLSHHMSSAEGEALQNFHAVSDLGTIAYQQRSLSDPAPRSTSAQSSRLRIQETTATKPMDAHVCFPGFEGFIDGELVPGHVPSGHMQERHTERDSMRHDNFNALPMGHTNRLVLEQMIQESISNMAIPALNVEKVDSPPRPRKSKKSVRTLFGMRKPNAR